MVVRAVASCSGLSSHPATFAGGCVGGCVCVSCRWGEDWRQGRMKVLLSPDTECSSIEGRGGVPCTATRLMLLHDAPGRPPRGQGWSSQV
ncbi:hypothetical protein LY78DRAFT_129798 [Colletotrichum sublineola]|nr:hypothetical protein LY78DRAFT_129798 [Colletotrichum sublineola]